VFTRGPKARGFCFRTPTNSTELMRGLGRVQPDCLATMFGVRDHHHAPKFPKNGSKSNEVDRRWPDRSSPAGVRAAPSNTQKSTAGTRKGWHEMHKSKSTTYTKTNFEQIATAIGAAVKPVADLKAQFEAAALWFRLDSRRPKRPAPSKQRVKLNQVAKSARRLLKSLGIDDPDAAVDGPGDAEIFKALVLTGEPNENAVLEATRRIGRLVEITEWIATAAEFERRAETAAIELAAVGNLTVREGNTGDDAVNDWIAAMLGVYRTLTGKEPATSVGAPDRANEGIAAGPLIRFLQAAGVPLKIEFSEDAWRSRVRTILKDSTHKN